MPQLFLSLKDNPQQYRELIDYALGCCDAFLLMEFPQQYKYYLDNKEKYQDEIDSFNNIINKLKPYELYNYFTFGWPGTNEDIGFRDIVKMAVQEHRWSGKIPIKPLLSRGIAHIYLLNEHTADILKNETDSFLSWTIPSRLEDLSFFTKIQEDQYGNALGGELILYTIAHEDKICMNIDEEKLEELKSKVPSLTIRDWDRTLVHELNI